MEIYKENDYIIFNLNENGIVKYNLKDGTSIGNKGQDLSNIYYYLKGYSFENIKDSCKDKTLKNFFYYIHDTCCPYNQKIFSHLQYMNQLYHLYPLIEIWNNGVLVSNVKKYIIPYYENERYITKEFIEFEKDKKILVTNIFIRTYNKYSKEIEEIYNEILPQCNSLNENDIKTLLEEIDFFYYKKTFCNIFFEIYEKFNYNLKDLILFFDNIKNYEGVDIDREVILMVFNYNKRNVIMEREYDKFPQNFLTIQQITKTEYNTFIDNYKWRNYRFLYRWRDNNSGMFQYRGKICTINISKDEDKTNNVYIIDFHNCLWFPFFNDEFETNDELKIIRMNLNGNMEIEDVKKYIQKMVDKKHKEFVLIQKKGL